MHRRGESTSQTAARPCLRALIAEWIIERERADALLLRWQALEAELIRDHGAISIREACRRRLPQATSMRAIDAQYRALSGRLDRQANVLSRAQPVTSADALAKIALGLRMTEHDPDDAATDVIRTGLRELAAGVPEEFWSSLLTKRLDAARFPAEGPRP